MFDLPRVGFVRGLEALKIGIGALKVDVDDGEFSPNPNLLRAGLAMTSSKICRAVRPSLTIFVPHIVII
jgi:hypothetical protein